VPDVEAALAGARDILAEQLTEDAAIRGESRRLALQRAIVICRAAGEQADVDPGGKYRLYYDAALPWPSCNPIRRWPSTAARPTARSRCRWPCPKRTPWP